MHTILNHDFSINYSSIKRISDGRLKTRVSLKDKNSGKSISAFQITLPSNSDPANFHKEIIPKIEAAAIKHADKLIHHLTAQEPLAITLGTYALLRWNKIDEYVQWAGKEKLYRNIWTDELLPYFGRLSLNSTLKQFHIAMDKITNRSKTKNTTSDIEHTYWIILNDILSFAINEKLLETEDGKSPLAALAANAQAALTTIAGENMARRSLFDAEAARICDYCMERKDESDAYSATLLALLTGLTTSEICALNIRDMYSSDGVSWLQISRVYNQVRGKQPTLTPLLEDVYAYRYFPCTSVVKSLWQNQVSRQKARGIVDNNAPKQRGHWCQIA